MISEAERDILGSLIFKPELLETAELKSDDFTAGHPRRVFQLISEIWESERPAEIQAALLYDRLSGNGSATFVGWLLDNRIKAQPEPFKELVLQHKRALINRRIRRAVEGAGEHFSADDIAADLAEYQALGDYHAVAFQPLSTVEPEPVAWLWPNFFPLGKVSLISGDPNAGKTWLALDCAARVTRGSTWPDRSPGLSPANVIFLSGEDEAADTLRPRLDGLDADPARVFFYENPLDLAGAKGLALLEREVARLGSVRLVVLDPAFDFSGRTNPNAVEQVRGLFLSPLARLAQKYELAVILVSHLNKSSSLAALHRTAGSASAWMGKVRAAFLVFRDCDDRSRRYFHAVKSNLSPVEPPQLAFRIAFPGRLEFEPDPTSVDPDEMLNPDRREDAPALAEAGAFLREELKAGPSTQKDIIRKARDAGIARRTLDRAKRAIGVKSNKVGSVWLWKL